jgi:hypothetical protein
MTHHHHDATVRQHQSARPSPSPDCSHRSPRIASSPRDRLRASASAPARHAAHRTGSGQPSHHVTTATRADDRHASVEQLSVPVITAIASACLVNRDTLADIKPSFENDTNIVPMPPE